MTIYDQASASATSVSELTEGAWESADIKDILYSSDQINQRVAELGQQITEYYSELITDGRPLLVISVLRGACIFMCDLVRHINVPVELDFMAVSSYGSGTKTSGVVKIIKDLSTKIEGRHVLIAEDVLDSGLTLDYLMNMLQTRNPASLEVCTLLRKPNRQQADIDCKYIGFDCPDEFIVGYGLDYAEMYRNLPYIGIMKPEVYQGK